MATTTLQKLASGKDCGLGVRPAGGGEEETNTQGWVIAL